METRTIEVDGSRVTFRVEQTSRVLSVPPPPDDWQLIGADGKTTARLEVLGQGARPTRTLDQFSDKELAERWKAGPV